MISLNDARRVIAAAENEARKIVQPMNIAVVDAGGNLVSHVRMDGAWSGQHRHRHQQSLHGAGIRHLDGATRREQPAGAVWGKPKDRAEVLRVLRRPTHTDRR
jgi:hypothetical protein